MGKRVFQPLPTRPQLVLAAYPALFFKSLLFNEHLRCCPCRTHPQVIGFFIHIKKIALKYQILFSVSYKRAYDRVGPFFYHALIERVFAAFEKPYAFCGFASDFVPFPFVCFSRFPVWFSSASLLLGGYGAWGGGGNWRLGRLQ